MAHFCCCFFDHLFNKYLAEELARHDEITIDEAREVVKQAFHIYLCKGFNAGIKNEHKANGAKSSILARLNKRLKAIPLIKAFRGVMKRNVVRVDNLSLPMLLNAASPYHHDFMPVYQAIVKGEVTK